MSHSPCDAFGEPPWPWREMCGPTPCEDIPVLVRSAVGLEAALPVFCPHAFLSVSSCRILAELAMMLWLVVGALFPALLLAAPPPINKLALFPDKSAWCEAKNITQIVGHSGCESKSIQNRYGPTLAVELDAADVPLQVAPKGLWGLLLAQEAGCNALPLPRCLLSVSGEGQISFRLSWEEQAPPLSPHPSCCLCRACLGQCFSYSVPNTFPQSTESLVHCDSCMPAQSMWEIVSIPRLLRCPACPTLRRGSQLYLGRVVLLPWSFPSGRFPAGCLSGDCTLS